LAGCAAGDAVVVFPDLDGVFVFSSLAALVFGLGVATGGAASGSFGRKS
jgi:hypothetical protein